MASWPRLPKSRVPLPFISCTLLWNYWTTQPSKYPTEKAWPCSHSYISWIFKQDLDGTNTAISYAQLAADNAWPCSHFSISWISNQDLDRTNNATIPNTQQRTHGPVRTTALPGYSNKTLTEQTQPSHNGERQKAWPYSHYCAPDPEHIASGITTQPSHLQQRDIHVALFTLWWFLDIKTLTLQHTTINNSTIPNAMFNIYVTCSLVHTFVSCIHASNKVTLLDVELEHNFPKCNKRDTWFYSDYYM